MSRVRVFVPSSFSRVREAVGMHRPAGVGDPVLLQPGAEVHAVTEALRAEFPGADEEELEYLAMTAAAQRSVAQVDTAGPHGRVVLAADVDSVTAAGGEDPTLVLVDRPLPLSDVVSAHVDAEEAGPAVLAARTALDAPAADADDRLTRCLDHELGWYAASELGQVAARAAGD